MQRGVEAQDFVIDPALWAPRSRRGAGLHHIAKGLVGGEPEAPRTHGAGQAARDMEIVQREDAAFVRRHPVKRGIAAPLRHGKQPLGIGAQQYLGRQVRGAVHARMIARGATCDICLPPSVAAQVGFADTSLRHLPPLTASPRGGRKLADAEGRAAKCGARDLWFCRLLVVNGEAPGPAAARYRKMKQNRIAASPPFCAGKMLCGK